MRGFESHPLRHFSIIYNNYYPFVQVTKVFLFLHEDIQKERPLQVSLQRQYINDVWKSLFVAAKVKQVVPGCFF
ncbi:hypothetical protein BK132_13600 [Paenibacillus sp. FSL H8-0259]|nr:hypothetical protein BK132_13600 [Paenibacillus sp. FSL H8-0259]